jgi:hypothetical protein
MVEIKFKDYTVITDEDGSIHDVLFKEDSKPMLMLGSGRFIHHMLAEIVRLRGVVDEVHSWIVCAPIATAEDMMQSAEHIMEITAPKDGQ